MSLLVIPLELFQEILDHYILGRFDWSKRGFGSKENETAARDIIGLRLVHSLFNREVLRACVRTQALLETVRKPYLLNPKDLNRPVNGCCSRKIRRGIPLARASPEFMTRYLMYCERKDDNTTSGGWIAAVVEVLVDLYSDSSWNQALFQEKRWEWTLQLCRSVKLTTYVKAMASSRDIGHATSLRHVVNHVVTSAIYLCFPISTISDLIEKLRLTGQPLSEISSEILGHPLTVAVKSGDYDLIQMLLEKGADVNVEKTLLAEALSTPHYETIIKLLLDPKYGYKRPEDPYEGPYEDAIIATLKSSQNLGLMRYLIDRWQSLTPVSDLQRKSLYACLLRASCEVGAIDALQWLIAEGGNVNESIEYEEDDNDNDLRTVVPGLVEIAAWQGHEHILRFLLDRGANPHGAVRAIFENNVSDLDHADKTYNSPFKSWSIKAAVWSGRVDIVEVLLDAGLSLDKHHWAEVLEIAAHVCEATAIVELLLSRGYVNIQELEQPFLNGKAFVASAAAHGNVPFIKLMAEHGIPLDDEELYIKESLPPPIILAKAFKQTAVVDTLLELGAEDRDPTEYLKSSTTYALPRFKFDLRSTLCSWTSHYLSPLKCGMPDSVGSSHSQYSNSRLFEEVTPRHIGGPNDVERKILDKIQSDKTMRLRHAANGRPCTCPSMFLDQEPCLARESLPLRAITAALCRSR